MRIRAKVAWAALCFAAAAICDSPFEKAFSQAKDQCWSADALVSRPEEKAIRRLPYSRSIEPRGEDTGVRQSVAPGWRGSIRRVQLPPGQKLIALTFDLCENGNEISGYDGEIVDTLRRLGVKATFFASGKWLVDHPERAQQLVADPLFEVGGHSWTHKNFHLLTAEQVKDDLAIEFKADAALRRSVEAKACFAQVGHSALKSQNQNQSLGSLSLFRFPFGTCNPETLREVNDEGLLAIQWDVVSADGWPKQTPEALRLTVTKMAKPGSIVVMHGNGRGHGTSQALPLLIANLREKGFQFATVSDLLAKGQPVIADTCYEERPGDNVRYDKLFGVNDQTSMSRALAPRPAAR